MVSVAAQHGETTTSAHLIPLSVDGLVVVASICLVEIGARLRAHAVDARAPLSLARSTSDGSALEQEVTGEPQGHERHDQVGDSPDGAPAEQEVDPAQGGATRAEQRAHGKQKEKPGRRPERSTAARRDVPRDTAAAVARLHRRNPALTAAEIAARLSVHPSTVRRHLAALNTSTSTSTRPTVSTDSTTDPSTDTSTSEPGASASRAA